MDDTGAFEAANDSNTGGVPNGLSAGITAITFNQKASGQNVMGVSASVLGGPAKSREQWLATFADASNWNFGGTGGTGTLPAGTIAVAAVPEPETCALMLVGLGLVGWAARRRRA